MTSPLRRGRSHNSVYPSVFQRLNGLQYRHPSAGAEIKSLADIPVMFLQVFTAMYGMRNVADMNKVPYARAIPCVVINSVTYICILFANCCL